MKWQDGELEEEENHEKTNGKTKEDGEVKWSNGDGG